MEDNILKPLNSIIYYIDEYKKGNPDVDESVMIMIAKETKGFIKHNKMWFIYHKLLMSYIKLRIALVSYETINDERFIDNSNNYLLDLYMYLEYTNFIKDYINKCLKNKEYDNLDDVYILVIKLDELLKSLNLYTDDIYKILNENTASYTAIYPKNDYTELNNKKAEIEAIIKKLKKETE
jgi:hypothetical protein